ncbi:metallophosphoesterase family protein [Ideonella livida]|uniref:Metallophosphoesterase family protein n=1 Tax=Ideonella livida TaxID=2707176 RepID=A0A7C9PI71_9BURK|nr:metallophosphoesterase family protein [Ideonella livida]NDY91714.1 metallophosphoesterase family protein [Ideonella livida]
MKLALITDLHANREAVQAVLDHARQQGVQRYAFLGDYVGYGADPGWVIDTVRQYVQDGAIAVGGNHDAGVVQGASPQMRPEARQVIEWTRAQLNDEQARFLTQVPLSRTENDMLFVHANAFAPAEWEYIQGRIEAVRSLHATTCHYTFCGHMHEPKLFHLSGTGKAGDFVPTPGVAIPIPPHRQWLVVPGSAGQPRDGNPAACYAIFNIAEQTLTFQRVPYDHELAADKIRRAGLPERLAARLAHGQ